MNHEFEVKVRWTIPGRHLHLTILLHNKYSGPIVYSFKKPRPKHMSSRSNKTCQTDMYIIKYFHIPNIVDLLHIVLEKRGQKLKTLTTEPWKWGQGQMTSTSWTCTPYNHSIHQISLSLCQPFCDFCRSLDKNPPKKKHFLSSIHNICIFPSQVLLSYTLLFNIGRVRQNLCIQDVPSRDR